MGSGSMGSDPVYLPAAVAGPLTPRAVFYDPNLKQFVLLDASGNAIDVHPVDQIVAMRLTGYQGQSPSAPDVGTRFRRITQGMPPAKAQQLATSEANRVLADLIAAGDITIQSVATDLSVYSRVMIAVTYVNLRDPRNSLRYPNTVAFSAANSA
jgi:hypothetical protein